MLINNNHIACYTDAHCKLSRSLADAVAENKEKMLRGLNGMCDDEWNRRVAQFIEANKPADGTQEEMAQFYKDLAAFKFSLFTIMERGNNEMLIEAGGKGQDDPNTPEIIKMYEKMAIVRP